MNKETLEIYRNGCWIEHHDDDQTLTINDANIVIDDFDKWKSLCEGVICVDDNYIILDLGDSLTWFIFKNNTSVEYKNDIIRTHLSQSIWFNNECDFSWIDKCLRA